MQTRLAIAIKRVTLCSPTLTLFMWLVALILPGCANTNGSANEADNQTCAVSDSLVRRNGTPGVQFINECKRCIAVAFEYRNQGKNSKWSACYVPPQSRVVFWEADEYWLITRKPCEIAKKQGLGGISTAELASNDQTGRCDTVDVMTN